MDEIHPLTAFRKRHEPPLSQQQLAEFLDVSRPTVTRWETGARKIEDARLQDVSKRTGIAPEVLRPDLLELLRRPETAGSAA